MSSARAYMVEALRAAEKIQAPFPHFFAENVFKPEHYVEIQQFLAKKVDFHEERFANRGFADKTDLPGTEFMRSRAFFDDMIHLFDPQLQARFGGRQTDFARDLRLIRDKQGYKIGPHTDARHKVLSLLFYLPPDDSMSAYGTSIFVPDDPERTCEGGPHYGFEGFTEIGRAPYVPNSCFGFWKTNNSFHGVYPIPVPIKRDVLLFNIYAEPSSE